MIKTIQEILILIIVASCASSSFPPSKDLGKISNDDFKKVTPLQYRKSTDHYKFNAQIQDDVLSDETTSRWSDEAYKATQSSKGVIFKMSRLCRERKFSQALALVPKHYQRQQKIPAFWNQVGTCHLLSKNDKKALLFYNKALEVSKNYVPALNNLGVIFYRQGELQKAQVAWDKALKSSRNSKTPRFNLAALYLRYGLAQESLSLFQGLFRYSPRDPAILSGVANSFYLLGKYQEANDYFRRMQPSDLALGENGLNYSMSLWLLNYKVEARKIFDSVKNPDSKELENYYRSIREKMRG